jgi:hypothetical protein
LETLQVGKQESPSAGFFSKAAEDTQKEKATSDR